MEIDRPGHSDDDIDVRLEWPGSSPTTERPAHLLAEPVTEAVPIDDDRSAGRAVIEAYDRLGDRLLERLRALRDGVDTDLAMVRSELASLRQAVDDVSDRVQLRELKVAIDELRGDIAGRGAEPGAGVAEVEAASIRAEVAEALEPLIEEVGELRTEVASLRRRISLRASGSNVELSDEQLQRIVVAISAHLSPGGGASAQTRAR